MKSWRLLIPAVILGLAFASLPLSQKYLTCQVFYRSDTKAVTGSKTLQVEIARTQTQKAKGLGGRACIKPNQAMLFVFDRPNTYAFWMKDMKFGIDIVWLDGSKNIVKIQPKVSPDTYPKTFANQKPAQYVLELKAGQAEKLGLKIGSQLIY